MAALLLVVAGVGYADWVLQLFLPVHASVMTSFISELSAAGQPYDDVFRVADLVGGALLAVGGALAWLASRRWPAIWLPLTLLGICIAVEAILPLGATFTFATMLPKTGTTVWWNRVTEPHGVVSFLEAVVFLVLFVNGTRALRHTSMPAGGRRALAAAGLTAVLLGVVTPRSPPRCSSAARSRRLASHSGSESPSRRCGWPRLPPGSS